MYKTPQQELNWNDVSMQHYELPDKGQLKKKYNEHKDTRTLVVEELHGRLALMLKNLTSHPSIKSRVKNFDSFFKKYIKLLKSSEMGSDKPRIADLLGIRVICPFMEDLAFVEEILRSNFEIIEVERKGSDYSFKEFGYESTHVIIKIPLDMLEKYGDFGTDAAEIQIRTILQDAWAEVEHELVYKAEFNPFDFPLKRKLAAVNASLSLADTIFQEVRDYQRSLNGQLDKRRDTFYKKADIFTDNIISLDEKSVLEDYDDEVSNNPSRDYLASSSSIDDLLLNALYAHNKNDFGLAIEIYSRIFEMNPQDKIKALIYKHRGMAFFAQSKYQEAIDDFSKVLEYDAKAYRAPYYRGIVYSVLLDYTKAIDDFSYSLEINPYQSFCLFRRCQAYFHVNDYPKALSDCENALVLDPGSEAIKKFKDLILNKLKM
jgi:putative GTP pyrophosphokinase